MPPGVIIATKICGLTFVIATMVSAGLSLLPREALGPLRSVRMVAAALGASFLAAPLLAWLISRVIPMEQAHITGLLLMSGAAGAPMLPKLVRLAGGDVALAIALMMLLLAGTIIFLPLAAPVLLPGSQTQAWEVARPLLVIIVAPLGAGMLLRALWAPAAPLLRPAVGRLGDLSFVAFVVLLITTNLGALIGMIGSGAIFAALLFILSCGGVAYILGPDEPGARRALFFSAAHRNIAAALVVAGNSFADQPGVLVMVVVVNIVGIVVALVAAQRFRRRGARAAAGPPTSAAPLDLPPPRAAT